LHRICALGSKQVDCAVSTFCIVKEPEGVFILWLPSMELIKHYVDSIVNTMLIYFLWLLILLLI
ncbi:hypothetical protein Q4R51_20095, partial [Morganella morganii]